MKQYCILALGLATTMYAYAQTHQISGVVVDKSGNTIPTVSVQIKSINVKTSTQIDGTFRLSGLQPGKYDVEFSHVGFKRSTRRISLSKDNVINVILEPSNTDLQEVYVTAKESKRISTSSIIDKEAMKLLQPSSFSDILELLPGGRSIDPDLTVNNRITLREANPRSGYETGSLGTQFSIDGASINNSGSLASMQGLYSSDPNASRDNTSSGIDMRSISTDNIARVEVIRGISSVEYGNITSGVVLIDRIEGNTPWTARLKMDGFSKLASIGKGISFKEHNYTLNMDAGYLYANDLPIDIFTKFQRVNTSIRGKKTWSSKLNLVEWKHNLDLNTTLDGDRMDPDNDYALTDSYKLTKRSIGLTNILKWTERNANTAFTKLEFINSISHNSNQLYSSKFTQASSATLLVNSLIEGSHEASYLTPSYVSDVRVSDKPFNINTKITSDWLFKTGFTHRIKIGAEHSYSKNFGFGQRYDINLPPQANIGVRPRDFRNVPAYSNLAIFAEDQFQIKLGKFRWENAVGIRTFSLLNLDNKYSLSTNFKIDPRWNSRLHLPLFYVNDKPFHIALSGGYGVQSLAPTSLYLNPQLDYHDEVELNYYHNNPAYRLAWANTTITDPTNYNLDLAKNTKAELGLNWDWNNYNFSITYFDEQSNSGFVNNSPTKVISYKEYDNTSVNPNEITSKPTINDFDFNEAGRFISYRQYLNGSKTNKRGVEYQFSTKRFDLINTRITLNGAWFRTLYTNSIPVDRLINSNVIVDGRKNQISATYLNIDGYIDERFNTNISFDSTLPILGLQTFVSFQSLWYTSNIRTQKSDLPISYKGIDGVVYPYTEEDRNNPILGYLDLKSDPILYRKNTIPLDLQVNLKAVKSIQDFMSIGMFVNRLIKYTPDYTNNGIQYSRRNFDAPYFGMELNLKF